MNTDQLRADREMRDRERDLIMRGHDPSAPRITGPVYQPGPHDVTLTPSDVDPGMVHGRCDSCGRWLWARRPEAAEAMAVRHKEWWNG